MEVNMTREDVLLEIQRLSSSGSDLGKKFVKKNNPQLMRSALHYFPDWDSAIKSSSA